MNTASNPRILIEARLAKYRRVKALGIFLLLSGCIILITIPVRIFHHAIDEISQGLSYTEHVNSSPDSTADRVNEYAPGPPLERAGRRATPVVILGSLLVSSGWCICIYGTGRRRRIEAAEQSVKRNLRKITLR